jgi:hypothetical protein
MKECNEWKNVMKEFNVINECKEWMWWMKECNELMLWINVM